MHYLINGCNILVTTMAKNLSHFFTLKVFHVQTNNSIVMTKLSRSRNMSPIIKDKIYGFKLYVRNELILFSRLEYL